MNDDLDGFDELDARDKELETLLEKYDQTQMSGGDSSREDHGQKAVAAAEAGDWDAAAEHAKQALAK